MIPRITKETHFYGAHPISSYQCYVVKGKHGSDECDTLGDAIRYWLWHCGVPARIAFWRFKNKKEYENSADARTRYKVSDTVWFFVAGVLTKGKITKIEPTFYEIKYKYKGKICRSRCVAEKFNFPRTRKELFDRLNKLNGKVK